MHGQPVGLTFSPAVSCARLVSPPLYSAQNAATCSIVVLVIIGRGRPEEPIGKLKGVVATVLVGTHNTRVGVLGAKHISNSDFGAFLNSGERCGQ